MSENICLFPKTAGDGASLSTIRFVYEREAKSQPLLFQVVYTFALVTNGSGILHSTHQWDEPLKKGDFFVLSSGKRFGIENTGELEYIYISMTGARVPALLKRIGFDRNAPIYHDMDELIDAFIGGITMSQSENTDLISESLVLLALSKICTISEEKISVSKSEGIFKVKEYIDVNFTDKTLNLNHLGEMFGYSAKYLSQRFRSTVGIGMQAYVNNLRMDYAKKCIKGGMTTVREISAMCGYTDALYFSKCFKKKYGVSPKDYINNRVS